MMWKGKWYLEGDYKENDDKIFPLAAREWTGSEVVNFLGDTQIVQGGKMKKKQVGCE